MLSQPLSANAGLSVFGRDIGLVLLGIDVVFAAGSVRQPRQLQSEAMMLIDLLHVQVLRSTRLNRPEMGGRASCADLDI